MGGGIAEVCARAGVDVVVFDTSEDVVEAGRDRIVKSLDRGVSNGKISAAEHRDAVGRLRFTTELSDMADRDLVIEAVIEDEKVKAAIFADLDRVVSADAVLASNTSSYDINELAAGITGPGRILGTHWFHPPQITPCVEVIPADRTLPACVD